MPSTGKTIDARDIEALEKSLNDSANKVSTIWISFVTFGLYLLLAISAITHKQLLLQDPIKLPVLNVDLPLVGFFLVAPVIFVLFHLYVMLQVLLLGRTAVAYNEAVDAAFPIKSQNSTIRQRLANTLFAQIFAGSPRERDGWIGWVLKVIYWATLVVAPSVVMLSFQFSFIAYHSILITWLHRILLLVELLIVVGIWPSVVQPQKDYSLRAMHEGRAAYYCLFFWLIIPVCGMSFPGEPQTNFLSSESLNGIDCEVNYNEIWKNYDRLNLPHVDLVDDEKFDKLKSSSKSRGIPIYRGERTRDFRGRDLNCADLRNSDMRLVDLSEAKLIGAKLSGADLLGSNISQADFRNANLRGATMDEVEADHTNFTGATANQVKFRLAQFVTVSAVGLQASGADMRGAQIISSDFRGSFLQDAKMAAAVIFNTDLQSSNLSSIRAPFASFDFVDITAANFEDAWLYGADLSPLSFDLGRFDGAFVGKTYGSSCMGANVGTVNFKIPSVLDTSADKVISSDAGSVEKLGLWGLSPSNDDLFIKELSNDIVDVDLRSAIFDRLEKQLREADLRAFKKPINWSDCMAVSRIITFDKFSHRLTESLYELNCRLEINQPSLVYYSAVGQIRSSIASNANKSIVSFIRDVAMNNIKKCPASSTLTSAQRMRLNKRLSDLEGEDEGKPNRLR